MREGKHLRMHRVQKLIVICLVVVLFSASCAKGPTPAPTPTPTATLLPTPLPTFTPTPEPTSTSPVPINYLVDVENAIIRVQGQGKFYSPKFTAVNGNPGRGSGFIIDPSGIAITTNQAVAGADQIQVWVGKDLRQSHNATVIATSECANLAVIDIDGEGYDFLSLADGKVNSAQKVYLAGFPLADPIFTLASGKTLNSSVDGKTITGLDSPMFSYEVKTAPGMPGGPIITPEGKVIGAHVFGNPDGTQGFGIALDSRQGIYEQLLSGQSIGSIGINGEAVSSQDGALSGMWVYAVQPDSLASRLGIEGGDLITNISDKYLLDKQILAQYCQILNEWDTKKPLPIQVYRSSTGALLGGQLNGSKLVVVNDQYAGPVLTPEAGTPVAPNLKASKPGDAYYKEDFDDALNGWKRFILQGDEKKVTAEVKDGKLVINIDGMFTYVYYIFTPLKVTDVRLDIKADNLGRNNNNISLVCRYSVEKGWYEFNIASNGLYWVKRYDPRFGNYVDIGKGASTAIRMGQATNDYGAVCKDNKLTLFINGKEVRTFTDNTLATGQVGFSVSSITVTPITVAVDSFYITVP